MRSGTGLEVKGEPTGAGFWSRATDAANRGIRKFQSAADGGFSFPHGEPDPGADRHVNGEAGAFGLDEPFHWSGERSENDVGAASSAFQFE